MYLVRVFMLCILSGGVFWSVGHGWKREQHGIWDPSDPGKREMGQGGIGKEGPRDITMLNVLPTFTPS